MRNLQCSGLQASLPRRIIAVLITVFCLVVPGYAAHGQVAPVGGSDAQRVVLLDRAGGLVSASLPLPDGTVLVAEGSSLARLRLDAGSAEVLGRVDPGYGMLLDLAGEFPRFYALAEGGVIALEGGSGDLPAVVDFVPGGGQALAVQGDLVAVAAREAGLRLLRVDGSGHLGTPAALTLPGGAFDLAFAPDGSQMYVAGGEAGVHVVGLADPDDPVLLRTFSQPAPAQTVAVVGALLAVGSGGEVSLLDPLSSDGSVIGVYAPLKGGRRMVIAGDYAYVADEVDGLKIIWLAAPDRPVQVYGEKDHPARGILLDGETLYLAGPDGLRILDVRNRYRPLEISRLDLPGQPQGIALAGGRTYVALGDEGVGVVNVENANRPRLERRIPLDGPAYALVYDRGWVYVAAGEAGIATIDAVEPGEEKLVLSLTLPGAARDIARRGRALYLAAGEAGLLAMDITIPDKPLLAGVLAPEAGRSFESLTISGSRAYVTHGDGFVVVDISRPDSMGLLASIDAVAHHVGVSDVYLYALGEDQITVYDARATAEPVALRSYIAPRHIADTSAGGDRLFLVHEGDGPDLVVLGLMTPDYPVELDNVGEQGHTLQARFSSGEVWLARGYGGLRRYGLSEGGALLLRGAYDTLPEVTHVATDGNRLLAGGRGGWSVSADGERPPQGDTGPVVRGLALAGDTVVVAGGEEGVSLYSLSGGGDPALLARYGTGGPATAVTIDGEFVYAADSGGLLIFDRRYLAPVRRIATPAPATGVAVAHNLAYVSLADGRLAVIDLANPTGGIRVRSSIKTQRPTDLVPAPDGTTIYGLADDVVSRLRTSDTDGLAVLGRGSLPAPAGRGLFMGGLLGAFTPGEGIRLYDVASLEAGVVPRGGLDIAGEDMVINGPVAYVAYGEGGLGLVEMRTPGDSHVFHPGEVHALLLRDETLFAVGGDLLTAWDVRSPASPRLLDSLQLFAPANHVDPAPDGTLLVGLATGLSIVRWDGASLSQTGNLWTAGSVSQAVQIGSRGYLALREGGLLVADLSDPANPASLFSTTSPSGRFVRDMLPLGEAWLLVSWEGGIDLLDVSATAEAPRVLSITELGASEALGLALSGDGGQAAVALGGEGAALLDLGDPRAPRVSGRVDTPGAGLAAVADGGVLYVADGLCGLRVFDVADPTAPREVGYWRGDFAADVAVASDVVYLADGNQLLTLRYDPGAESVPPPVPQFPTPSNGQNDALLTLTLRWEPPADPCDPLTYDIYFGVEIGPPYAGQVAGSPELEVGELEPLRTYYWRVESTDRQGDRVVGPVWHFTTVPADLADTLPPAPPLFVEPLRENPVVSLILGGALVGLVGWALYRRQAGRAREARETIPEWYSTGAEDED